MTAEQFVYRQLHTCIRPKRAVVRIGQHADDWEPTALRDLESFGVTWGGARDIVGPADDSGEVHSAIWAAIELHDPDLWAAYAYTFGGSQMANPDGYDMFLDG